MDKIHNYLIDLGFSFEEGFMTQYNRPGGAPGMQYTQPKYTKGNKIIKYDNVTTRTFKVYDDDELVFQLEAKNDYRIVEGMRVYDMERFVELKDVIKYFKSIREEKIKDILKDEDKERN